MTIYEKNLKTLAAYYPQMDALIEDAKKGIERQEEIIKEMSYDGDRILKISIGGKL